MIYENMLSGAFIYALGLVSGRRAGYEVTVDTINFINQTPYDRSIADLFAECQGKFFIVEFKKSSVETKKEILKPIKVKMRQDLLKDKEMLLLSRRCHYIAYGEQEGERVQAMFKEYVYVSEDKAIPTCDFIQGILDPDFPLGIRKRENIIKYMRFLLRYSNKGDVDAILICSSSGGKPMFFKIENYLQLGQALSPKIESTITQVQNIQPPKQDRTQSKGYGIS